MDLTTVRSKIGLACIFVSLAVGGGWNAPARAATPSHPSVFQSAQLRVGVGESVVLTCTAVNQVLRSFFFSAIDSHGLEVFVALFDPLDGSQAKIVVRGQGVEVAAEPTTPGSGDLTLTYQPGGVVGQRNLQSMAWGIWGDPLACSMTVEGVPATVKAQPSENGSHLSVTDYDGGVGALSYASLAAGQTYSQDMTGTMFAWLIGGAGVGTAQGPVSESYVSAGGPSLLFNPFVRPIDIAIAKETTGTWTFGLPAAAGLYEGPELWILDVVSF